MRNANKVQFGGVFFVARRSHVKAPRLPRITPQIDHQNTTNCTPFLRKTPAKTPIPQSQKKSAVFAIFRPLKRPKGREESRPSLVR
jgi:hypothetical protein